MADATTKTGTQANQIKKGRSPAYPAISLKAALDKAKLLDDAVGKYAAPMPVAFKAWGFSEKSSGGREVRASLRYFGLIEIEGDGDAGKVKLTNDAQRVLHDNREDQTEKRSIIRRLALNPIVHKKIFEAYPDGIKSEETVKHFLSFEEKYNRSVVGEIVAEFKETAAFAGLFQPDSMAVKSNDPVIKDAQPGTGVTPPQEDENPPPPPLQGQKVKVMDNERIVFTEESNPQVYLKLIASGEVDDWLLEALETYVDRQRKRLKAQADAKQQDAKAAN